MSTARPRPELAVLEVLGVLVLAVAPLPAALPAAAPLLGIAACSRWSRGRGFGELIAPSIDVALASVVVGAAALAIAAPLASAMNTTPVEWWLVPAAHEGGARLAVAAVIVVVNAIALELALRGWIVERMLELSPGPPTLPIVTAALAEAVVVSAPPAARIGALLFGAGLGLLYVAAGRNLLAPIVARSAFALGSLAWTATA